MTQILTTCVIDKQEYNEFTNSLVNNSRIRQAVEVTDDSLLVNVQHPIDVSLDQYTSGDNYEYVIEKHEGTRYTFIDLIVDNMINVSESLYKLFSK